MAHKKKITRRQKLALGMAKPEGNSKYGKKAASQARGKFNPNSPFAMDTSPFVMEIYDGKLRWKFTDQ